MSKYKIEIKWGVIFVGVTILWFVIEKLLGLHGANIAHHETVSMVFMVPAIAMFVFALLDKRKNYYDGKMTYLQGFISGVIISLVVMLLTPL